LGVKAFSYRRVKNDVRHAADLADLLRLGRLPEAWIAPPATRQLRELVRYRAKLVAVRSGLKAGVQAVLAKRGVAVPMSDLFGAGGQRLLDGLALPAAYAARIASQRRLIDAVGFEIDLFAGMIAARLTGHPGYRAVQAIDGVGPVLAAVFVAEIGDVHRFTRPQQLCSWAELTPLHRESDTKVHRGRVTKQGSTLVRWAAVEPCNAYTTGCSARPGSASANAAARTSVRSPPPASCSPWSTTACATATSARWPPGRREPIRTQSGREVVPCLAPSSGMRGRGVLIDPA
jgi:transposase